MTTRAELKKAIAPTRLVDRRVYDTGEAAQHKGEPQRAATLSRKERQCCDRATD